MVVGIERVRFFRLLRQYLVRLAKAAAPALPDVLRNGHPHNDESECEDPELTTEPQRAIGRIGVFGAADFFAPDELDVEQPDSHDQLERRDDALSRDLDPGQREEQRDHQRKRTNTTTHANTVLVCVASMVMSRECWKNDTI